MEIFVWLAADPVPGSPVEAIACPGANPMATTSASAAAAVMKALNAPAKGVCKMGEFAS